MAQHSVPRSESSARALFPDRTAASDPGRPAYVMASTGRTVTYGELVEASRDLAALLWSRGVRHGDCVAILMENTEYFLKIAWALQRIGLRYVAVQTRMTPAEIAYILNDSASKALFTTESLLGTAEEAVADAPEVVLRFTTGEARDSFESIGAALQSDGALAAPEEREGVDLLYSSGTTGRPKGVLASLPLDPLGTPPGFTKLFHQLWGIGDDTVYLSPAPLYHAAPLRVAMSVHRYGGTVVIMDKFDASLALALIEKYRVTHTQMVPTMLIRMLKLPDEQRQETDLSSLRVVIHAAAPCPPDIKRKLIGWFGPIVREFYSATENYLFTEIDSQEWLAHPGSVGRPIAGIPHILDDQGNELPPGETGTIWSEGGPQFEYLNDKEKTAQTRNDRGWTSVGDLGYVDEEGYVFLSDRRSDLILSGGVNIYPQEIENVLAGHPDVADVAVFGIPHDEMGHVVHAVVQLRANLEPSPAVEAGLVAYCEQHLARFKCPRHLDFASTLPRTPTGKLLKRLIRDEYESRAAVS
jgi:long-chain acyl-CoA synthetase